jgi:hypothetical protein
MSKVRQCLNCRNYWPDPPPDWKPPSYFPDWRYDVNTLRGHLGDYPQWNSGWPGQCVLQPTPVNVQSVYICAQWTVNETFLQDWADLRSASRLHAINLRLNKELKATKKLSLERYNRLKQVKTPAPPRRERPRPDAEAAVQEHRA